MRDSVEMVKEQLRMQAKELKRRDAEKAKHDAKIKHVLKLSQEKIEVLKTTVQEKDEEIQNKQFSGAKLAFDASKGSTAETAEDTAEREEDQKLIKELKNQLEQSGRDREKLAKDLKKASKAKDPPPAPSVVVETKEVVKEVKDPKLIKALKKLKLKNQSLEDRLEQHSNDQNRNDKEKELLAQEVQRLRKQPDSVAEIKKKIKQQEKKHEESIKSYEKIVKEKSELVDSYEKVMYESQSASGSTKLPSEIIKGLKEDLEKIDKEKDRLEQDLLREKKEFDNKLSAELQKIEVEWQDKLKKMHTNNIKDVGDEQGMQDEGAPLWMITFADMVTLLLTFFILYYSIASMNMQKFKEAIIGEEQASIGLLELLDSAEIKESIQNLTGLKSNDILKDITKVAEESELNIETDNAKIIVRVPGASLFKPGQADLQLSARPVLDEVIRVVNKYPDYKIHIQGHTDDESISTERFPTNWELSAARATAVLRYFYDKGAEPERMTATGYADTFPLATNDTVPGRAKNRRVEFVLEKEK
ncbi:MAG: OmpA family protein [Nitrospinae bacterium]|nr:OmpA family protein [Nitrospinota bacterium]MBL7019130.1 OmpA family protein [Nitrospinaceae bacterium]